MKSLAVTKSDMALLSQEQLTQATFGALCQSFAMQILDRSGYEDGMYQRVALEFLEEESEQPQQPIQNVFNIDLKLVLETIRKEAQNQKREKKETEKLLEQVLRVQQAAEQKQIAMPHTSPVERTYLLAPQHSTVARQSITVHNSFHQHGAAEQFSADRNRLQQAAGRAEQEVWAQFDLPGSQTRPIPGGPGSLSSRTERFVRQMQEGRDLMEPGSAQPRKQPVIPGRKIEQSASVQQALQPAAQMELKTEPAQTPEPGKTAAEAVAKAMKTAVERQLQNLQSSQAPAEIRKERSPEQQEAGQLSQPEAHHKEGQPITTKTIGQKALQPQSVIHIQQEIPAVQSAEEKNLRNRSEINQRRFERLSQTAAAPGKEAAMTAAGEIRVTGQKVGTVPDALVQAPVPTQQNVIFETRPRENLSFLQTEEAVQAERREGTTPVLQTEGTDTKTGKATVLSEEQQRERLLQTSLTRIREPLTQTIRQDIRITGGRPDRAVAASRSAEKTTQQNITDKLQETKAQNTVQPIHAQSSAAAQQLSGSEQSGLTKTDIQFLSESQGAKLLETARQDTKPISQRNIRVTGSSLETTVAQEQTEQPVISAVLSPMGSTEELAFRQKTGAQTAVQPDHVQRSATQSANISQPNPAVMQPSHTNRSVVAQQMIGGERTVFPSYVTGLTEADLQFLSESQRTQMLEAAKQDAKPVIQQNIRVAGSGLEITAVQEQTEQSVISAMLPPMTQSTAAAQQPRGSEQFGVPGLTEKALQFLFENQGTQLPETIKQDRQPISQRDIRVAGNGLESTVAQGQVEQTEIPVVIPHGSGTEELTFHQEDASFPQPEKADTVQIPNTQNPPAQAEGIKEQSSVAAVQQASNTGRPLSPTYTGLLRTFAPELTEADLQFLSEDQRARVLAAVRQGAQPISQRDIRVAGSGLESAFGQEQAEQASIPAMISPMGGTEELSFRQDAEEQVNVQPEKPGRADSSRVLHPAEQSNLPKTRQSINAERPLSPTYTGLLRTFAPGLTEADLQFLSEGQRAQVLETIRQGAPSVPSIGGRDIRVTANSPEQDSVVTEQDPNLTNIWSEGIRSEELTFRQEKEPQLETMDSQRASVEQFAADKAQAVSKRDNRAIPSRKQANPIPDAAHSVNRDIRVLADHGTNQMTVRAGEPIKSMPVGDLTPAELALLSQSQQHTIQGRLSHLQTESADQMMQSTAMDELHHRQMQPEEPSVSKTDASNSTIQPQPGQTRSTPADIRILRQLGVARPMGQQSRGTPEQKKLFQTPSPVDLQLPTGADAGQRAAEKPVQDAEHVGNTPVNLTYSPAMVLQQSQPPKDPTAPSADARPASSYVNSLPQWAQNFVRSGSTTPVGITPPAPIAGVAREIAALPGNGIGGDGQTMDWSAPNRPQMANQAAHRPAEVVFKEQNQEEERQRQSVHMSESELRRTADKIYQIIEDRIRRERRLLGL